MSKGLFTWCYSGPEIEVALNAPTPFPKPKDRIGAQGSLKFHKQVPARCTAGSLGRASSRGAGSLGPADRSRPRVFTVLCIYTSVSVRFTPWPPTGNE